MTVAEVTRAARAVAFCRKFARRERRYRQVLDCARACPCAERGADRIAREHEAALRAEADRIIAGGAP